MNASLRKLRAVFLAAAIFGILSPCTLLLLLKGTSYTEAFLRFIGICFWSCLLLELLLFLLCGHIRKKAGITEKNVHFIKKKQLPGLLTFFSNFPAGIADLLLLPLTAWVVIAFITRVQTRWLVICSVVVCLICYQLHSILNGVNYRILAVHRKKRTRRKKP